VKWIKVFPSAYNLKRVQPLAVKPPIELHSGLLKGHTHFFPPLALRKTCSYNKVKIFKSSGSQI